MTNDPNVEPLIALFDKRRHDIRVFMEGVLAFIGQHPDLTDPTRTIVHSYKSRVKDRDHLREKIVRKIKSGAILHDGNFFDRITDLAGVRILHIFQEDFANIDAVIRAKVLEGDWHLAERAKAYTWDPEAANFFKGFNLDVSEKATSYTSVHYLVRPRADSPICCEIQVRTLFEEIWGEVDHQINYPHPTNSLACREQIKVLSKIVGAGSRLLDSLRRVHQDHAS